MCWPCITPRTEERVSFISRESPICPVMKNTQQSGLPLLALRPSVLTCTRIWTHERDFKHFLTICNFLAVTAFHFIIVVLTRLDEAGGLFISSFKSWWLTTIKRCLTWVKYSHIYSSPQACKVPIWARQCESQQYFLLIACCTGKRNWPMGRTCTEGSGLWKATLQILQNAELQLLSSTMWRAPTLSPRTCPQWIFLPCYQWSSVYFIGQIGKEQ